MEYLGSVLSRNVDYKRRFLFPAEWIDESTIFFVVQDEDIQLYSYAKWKAIMVSLSLAKEKISWAEKSTQVHLDDTKRLLLPKTMKWKKIDLIGMIDYIIIRESAV
jgi:hypothetical protein